MSESILRLATVDDIARIDAELDRIRWYISQLSYAVVVEGIDPKLIAKALKTGEAVIGDLYPEK